MPFNQYNVGRDFVVDITTQLGVQTFAIITELQSKQRTKSIESHALDGQVRFAELPSGWEGSLHFDRAGPSLDIFFSTLEAAYYGGVPILSSTITETVSEVDGSITQWLYSGVVFVYEDAGSKKGDDKVMQRVAFKCSRRTQLL